ncbi:MAG TPA: hypothetical protein VKB12_14905 [Pyrinomonadaceae bacterium]|nr:hypothetical protein [Pyrinomonadaceae bacterium]
MRRLVHAVCLAVLTLAFVRSEAAAQPGRRRIGLPRPSPGQPAQPPAAATPTPAPSASPSQAATQQASASQYRPAVEYQSFMQLRFYENQGGFLVEDLEVVFPPPVSQKASFVVSKAGGGVVATVPLRLEAPLASYTVFGMFKPDGVPGLAPVGEPGDYVLSVQIDGQPITTLPFSMKRETGTDPFNPTTTFVREGPWRDLAYFSNRPEEPDSHLEFSWWTSLRELPPGTKNPLVTLHLLYGGQEVAATRSPVVPTQTDWQFLYQEFVLPAAPVRWMTLADLMKRDGEYTVVAKVNGKPFKSYKAEVRGGQLQRHPRNSLNTEPHTAFISPRLVDTSARTSSRYAMRDTYWVVKK